MKLAIVLICALAYGLTALAETDDEAWEKFKKKNGKVLKGGISETIRKNTFIARRRKIETHNAKFAKGEVKFRVGLNKYADLPLETIRKFRNGRKSSLRKVAPTAPKLSLRLKGSLPKSVNWAKKGMVTSVKDQGECGSCYTFSTAAYLESQYLLSGNKSRTSFSEQQSLDCTSGTWGNSGCNGGLEANVFRYLQTQGLQTRSSYPYAGKKKACKHDASFAKIKVTKVYNYQNVTEEYLKTLVATRGPICVGMYASDDYLQLYTDGVYECSDCPTGADELDHAVLLVGYGTEDGEDYWRIKNSWGDDWGDDGYLKIARQDNNCGILSDVTFADVMIL